MGLGIKFYVWDEDKGFKKPLLKDFRKSIDGIPNEDLIEYAGKRIKYVLVYLEMKNRKPVGIVQIDCRIYSVDDEGKFNQNEVMESRRLIVNCLNTPEGLSIPHKGDDTHSNIIWSSGFFARKRVRDVYSWELSGDQIDQLIEDIFK